MTDLKEAAYLLGCAIVRDRATRTIYISQQKYATKVLDRFRALLPHPFTTPMKSQCKAGYGNETSVTARAKCNDVSNHTWAKLAL
ncbi:TPA: hypothetical protein N0F65_005472 [Lagenidium giganteum]|uniref:Uncharacterized protein n=1 Tax=Lagenidium giganteum TaxID=4803 RepID=A0AAV2Z118_9STRA|nr:TPA: hypothetical protein N0F65_005472 [Lagenidium giganteum]